MEELSKKIIESVVVAEVEDMLVGLSRNELLELCRILSVPHQNKSKEEIKRRIVQATVIAKRRSMIIRKIDLERG